MKHIRTQLAVYEDIFRYTYMLEGKVTCACVVWGKGKVGIAEQRTRIQMENGFIYLNMYIVYCIYALYIKNIYTY